MMTQISQKGVLLAHFLLIIWGYPSLLNGDIARILLVAGEPSHGWDQHEFVRGSEVLAQALNQAGLPMRAEVSEGWPGEGFSWEGVQAIILYSDGEERHVAAGRTSELRRLHREGTGVVVLHYALEGADPGMNQFFGDSIGGFFEVGWSVNPRWEPDQLILHEHPITAGVEPFTTEDEWYFHMRFREGMAGITPVLSTHPPESILGNDGPRSGNPVLRKELESGVPQILAWATENPGAGRGFALTGGNFHSNWGNREFRTLVLNGIVWAAGIEVPGSGLSSPSPVLVKYETIGEAIARNDPEDVGRHIELDPGLLNTPGRGGFTPLHQAIMRKRPAVAEILLELGADPNVPTQNRQTALHVAVDRNLPEVAEWILKAGVDTGVRDSQGWTALHVAAAKNNYRIARILIENGADVNRLSELGGTPLHEAAAGGEKALIELFLEAGTDPTVVSKTGQTALDIAVSYGNEAAINVLKPLAN